MRARTFTVVLFALGIVGMTGVSAYTTAQVDSEISVNVNSDDASIIQLTEGEGSQLLDGELVIDAEGEQLNQDAEFVYGDSTAVQNSNNFELTNTDGATRTYTVSEDVAGSSVRFEFYDSGNSLRASTESSTADSFDLASGETAYVVLVIEDTGTTTGDGALSGTVTIDAE